ncbi:MinD/ParA family protein [Bacillus sp. 31A1R]|uniref:MinD/ParA family protein n=1 Tax=Robertmurraya mangrovi TaxID=3098077 RepID=A0ABU5J219_9BACI|nr:MinD/ParA family protein [Bacillus sp. 31A1R]MDZ5473463.1 MinD/ParA family protein [Bacillus sp. 31A1R]
MKDQAEALRLKMKKIDSQKNTKTLAVVSGKGGVGKSNFSLNFSISLTKRGHKVLLFDMDVGMGNIDILMGKTSRYSIVDYFNGKESLRNIVSEGLDGLHYIAGGAGLSQLIKLEDHTIERFFEELEDLLFEYEYVIFDMGAGASEESLKFILSVDEIFVITTPEPTSITDAYSMMKFIHLNDQSNLPFYIVVNRVSNEKEGQEIYNRIQSVVQKFLGREAKALGMLPDDRALMQAVIKQVPFIYNGKSNAAKALSEITDLYERQQFKDAPTTKVFNFASKLKRFLFER